MAYYHRMPTAHIVWLPFFILLGVFAAVGVGFWLSALNVKYRDVRYVVPFLVQFWMFASPIVYSSSLVPARWRTLYALNPMVGVVDGFRWSFLGTAAPGPVIAASAAATLALFVGRRILLSKNGSSIR